MVRLGVELQFITPFHVGFDKSGRLAKTEDGRPAIPQIVLSTQLAFEASRFSPHPVPPPRVSPGFFVEDELRLYKIKVGALRKEFVRGRALFTVSFEEEHLPFILAALASRSFAGWGGETSHGFGAARVMIRSSSVPPDALLEANPRARRILKPGNFPFPKMEARFPQEVWESLKRRWRGWLMSVGWFGKFEKRTVYMGREFIPRGALRRALNEAFGRPHKDEILVCPPKREPCPVCRIMGALARKSGVISRPIRGGQLLIVEAIPQDLLPTFEEVIKGLGFEKDREEGRDFYLVEGE